jgi:glycine betaine/proline transport system ATP-binding protein
MTNSTSTKKISCLNVWKIFGPDEHRLLGKLDDNTDKGTLMSESGNVIAVQDVSFSVDEGETFVIMGLSGSGKSTLIRCLSRLVEATSGEIWVDGEEVRGMSSPALREFRRHKVAMVFQHFGNFPHKSVLDNVAYGLEVQGISRPLRFSRAMEVIELVGLLGWEHNFPDELSGGMQQRVGLARALTVDPEILLFDEPFSALDPLIRREMQNELLILQKQVNKTIIFITHDITEAVRLGDRVAIMKDGRFIQVGTPAEVIMHPVDEYVRDFVNDVPRSRILKAASIVRPIPTLSVGAFTAGKYNPSDFSSQTTLGLVDDDSKFVGILHADDLLTAMRSINSISELSQNSCSEDASLDEVLKQIGNAGSHVAVLKSDGQLMGTIAKDDVVRAMISD